MHNNLVTPPTGKAGIPHPPPSTATASLAHLGKACMALTPAQHSTAQHSTTQHNIVRPPSPSADKLRSAELAEVTAVQWCQEQLSGFIAIADITEDTAVHWSPCENTGIN